MDDRQVAPFHKIVRPHHNNPIAKILLVVIAIGLLFPMVYNTYIKCPNIEQYTSDGIAYTMNWKYLEIYKPNFFPLLNGESLNILNDGGYIKTATNEKTIILWDMDLKNKKGVIKVKIFSKSQNPTLIGGPYFIYQCRPGSWYLNTNSTSNPLSPSQKNTNTQY
jgi:hypothetical protein